MFVSSHQSFVVRLDEIRILTVRSHLHFQFDIITADDEWSKNFIFRNFWIFLWYTERCFGGKWHCFFSKPKYRPFIDQIFSLFFHTFLSIKKNRFRNNFKDNFTTQNILLLIKPEICWLKLYMYLSYIACTAFWIRKKSLYNSCNMSCWFKLVSDMDL